MTDTFATRSRTPTLWRAGHRREKSSRACPSSATKSPTRCPSCTAHPRKDADSPWKTGTQEFSILERNPHQRHSAYSNSNCSAGSSTSSRPTSRVSTDLPQSACRYLQSSMSNTRANALCGKSEHWQCTAISLSARRCRRKRKAMTKRHEERAPPNWSFNRSANGWPPCPRGAVCISCTSRARRPPVVALLTLR